MTIYRFPGSSLDAHQDSRYQTHGPRAPIIVVQYLNTCDPNPLGSCVQYKSQSKLAGLPRTCRTILQSISPFPDLLSATPSLQAFGFFHSFGFRFFSCSIADRSASQSPSSCGGNELVLSSFLSSDMFFPQPHFHSAFQLRIKVVSHLQTLQNQPL